MLRLKLICVCARVCVRFCYPFALRYFQSHLVYVLSDPLHKCGLEGCVYRIYI